MFRRATGRNNFLFPSTLFLGRRSWVKDADIWHFHNLHGHFASIPALARLSLHKRIVLSPVDQFLATGYCTYALGCERFRDACGECPQLDLAYPGLSRDTTSELLAMKRSAVGGSRFNFLVHTKYLADFYASTFVGKRPIDQIYYGVDTQTFRPMGREVQTEIGMTPSGRLTLGLLHSDIIDRRKGLLPLIHSLQSLAGKMPQRLRLLVIGKSSDRALELATENLPIVTLPFLTDNDSLAKALNACDLLLYPTKADNLSLTCLNALACGVPVISSRVGGQPEAVRDNVNGFLCEPDQLDQFVDRVEQLASDEILRRRLSAEARRIAVAEFDIETYISKLIAYYNRLVALPDN
jgi:glycosyltransferase involved in cell wall biosynthesis